MRDVDGLRRQEETSAGELTCSQLASFSRSLVLPNCRSLPVPVRKAARADVQVKQEVKNGGLWAHTFDGPALSNLVRRPSMDAVAAGPCCVERTCTLAHALLFALVWARRPTRCSPALL